MNLGTGRRSSQSVNDPQQKFVAVNSRRSTLRMSGVGLPGFQ
jgi:hypothetical protein